MAKKWRTSIRKLLHKTKRPNEQQVIPTKEICHISSKEPQRDEKLRWDSFENKLAQRMGSTEKKNAADEGNGSEKEVAKSPSLHEIRPRSVIEDDLVLISEVSVRNTVLTSTIDDKDAMGLLNTSSIRLNETEASKSVSKSSSVKAVMEKSPISDSVSLKSSARSESTGLTSASGDNDITGLISAALVQLKESGPSEVVSQKPSEVVSQKSSAKTVTEKPPESKSFTSSASSATKASTRKLSESDSVSLTPFARSASNAWKAFMNKASESDSSSLKSAAGSTRSAAMTATKQPSESSSNIRESPTRSKNSTWTAFANKTSESDSVTGKLQAQCASSSAMAVTKRPSESDSASLKSTARRGRSPAMTIMKRPSEEISATLPPAIRSTIITVVDVVEKPFSTSYSTLKSPAGSASTTASETTSITNDSPSMDTDSISYTEFSGSYTRERLPSFLDEDESSLVTESYTHAILDDESITGGIFERAVLRVGLLFLCNLTENDRCSSVKHG